jgi:hypothetical protein
MSRCYEYATTTAEIDASKAAELWPNPPAGDGWEMCNSNVVPGPPRREWYADEDTGNDYCKTFSTIRVVWFWKREVTK